MAQTKMGSFAEAWANITHTQSTPQGYFASGCSPPGGMLEIKSPALEPRHLRTVPLSASRSDDDTDGWWRGRCGGQRRSGKGRGNAGRGEGFRRQRTARTTRLRHRSDCDSMWRAVGGCAAVRPRPDGQRPSPVTRSQSRTPASPPARSPAARSCRFVQGVTVRAWAFSAPQASHGWRVRRPARRALLTAVVAAFFTGFRFSQALVPRRSAVLPSGVCAYALRASTR